MHPSVLLAAINDLDLDDRVVAGLERTVASLRGDDWPEGAPEFVDETEEEMSSTNPEDELCRTVGVILMLEDPRSPSATLAMQKLVDALTAFSATHSTQFVFELDEEHVDSITRGRPSQDLLVGLLGNSRAS